MKKVILLFCTVLSFSLLIGQQQFSKKIDKDKDGYHQGIDCDDNDPNVFPGAPELADGKDNDCDGNAE